MEHSTFLYGAIAIFGLLTLATVIHALCKQTKVPFAVGLLLGGFLLAFLSKKFELTILDYFHFSPEIVFYVFLPTLIFESSYHMKFWHFRGILKEVVSLATIGLIISIAIIGGGIHYFLDIPWVVSLLFGSLISATDPVAVLAIFKELRVPKKLSTIVDGESLLNDGTALVFFQFFLKLAIVGTGIVLSPKLFLLEGVHLFQTLFFGLLVGAVLGFVFSLAIARATSKGVQLTLSLILAHATFLFAEGILGVSGILATLTAGLIMGNFGRRKLTVSTIKSFSEIWTFLGFISNALIFILLGTKLGQIDFWEHGKFIAVAVVISLFIARPISVFTSFFLTNSLEKKKRKKISTPFQIVTMWGGIRGALAAAAVLMIPESFPYGEVLQAMTAGVILTTFLLNAMTLSPLLKKLKIIDFTDSEKIQQAEARILVDEKIFQYLQSLVEKKYIAESVFHTLQKKYKKERIKALIEFKKLKKMFPNSEREAEKILSRFALGIELKTYKKLFALREICETRFLVLRDSIFRQTERLDDDLLPEERVKTSKIAPEIPEKWNWLKNMNDGLLKKWGEKLFAHHQKVRILHRLQHYRSRRIASWKVIQDFQFLQKNHPIFSHSPIIERIIERYKFWNENSEIKMAELEEDYYDIAHPAREKIAENACLRREDEIEKEFFEKGFITEKVFEAMEDEIDQKAQKCKNDDLRFWEA